MPRYFFHTVDGTKDIDHLGHELPDDAAARCDAVRYAGGILSDEPDIVAGDEALRVNVTNENGNLSCSIVILAVDTNWRSDGTSEPVAQPTSPALQ